MIFLNNILFRENFNILIMLVKYTYNKLLSVIILLFVLNEELYVVFD